MWEWKSQIFDLLLATLDSAVAVTPLDVECSVVSNNPALASLRQSLGLQHSIMPDTLLLPLSRL